MWARNALAEKEHEFCKAQDEIYQKTHKKCKLRSDDKAIKKVQLLLIIK